MLKAFLRLIFVLWCIAVPSGRFAQDNPPPRVSQMTIETAKGTIVIQLYPDVAPNTIARISELVLQGFYNSLTFHRVEKNFVIQGGDPRGDGTGGSGKQIEYEKNALRHVKGAVGLARLSEDLNSADSQFYICVKEAPYLDGKFTVFGQVISGMNVVRNIERGDIMTRVTIR